MSLGLSPIKILVADDSRVYRKLVEESLLSETCSIIFAKNGREAMDLFAMHKPTILITDWTMPDISGPELCQYIRRKFDAHYSYVILLTSHSDKEQVIEGLSAGADDYLTKPFHPGELKARVRVGKRISDLHLQLMEKNRELSEMALSDPLTGLPNRRALDAWAAHQISAAVRHEFSIWIVLADLDHFKKINDLYGHDIGDMVLKGFAEVLKVNTRQSNICGRLGGEEFLTIITHIERKNVEIAIERIRKQFEAMKFTSGGNDFNVTASFGIAGLNGEKAISFHDLILRADAALYEAKDKGRNLIVFAAD